jgi:peptidoglycan/xylan/chitin deacetylase (PgdA/CDA1 family)
VIPPARALFWLATLGAIAFAARAALVAPPPAWLAATVLFAYVGFMTLGVLRLSLRMFVDAIVRGPKGARGVVLTFDDGPDPVWTPKVLDVLDEAGVKATFFVIGRKVRKYPKVARAIVDRGHTIGMHSFRHDRLMSFRFAGAWRRDLKRALRAINDATGHDTRLFRPPIGHTNPSIPGVLEELGLVTVGWSVSGRDGVSGEPDAIAARIDGGLEDGAIVLLHDAAEREDREPAGVLALPKILALIQKKGLEVVPLDEWVPPDTRGATR